MARREFMRNTGWAAASVVGFGVLLKGCLARQEYDLVIKQGLVLDGLGSPGRIMRKGPV